MTDPAARAAALIATVETKVGRSVAELADEVAAAGLSAHGKIVAHLKAQYQLTHGYANSMAHAIRTHLEGGPASDTALLDAQYAGRRQAMRPVYEALAGVCADAGPEVTTVVQKTGVSFRRAKQFALVQAKSGSRVELGLNLPSPPDDPRVEVAGGMCSHRVVITDPAQVDGDLRGWVREAYDSAG